MTKLSEYQKYEFCKSVDCHRYYDNLCNSSSCVKTARAFHKWIDKNNYKITKETASDDS
jgi:hypothetical protein